MFIFHSALRLTALLSAALAATAIRAPLNENPPDMRVLIVGGGPSKKYNQVGIESNVRYMERLLPAAVPRRILFADGDPQSASVLYTDEENKVHHRIPKIAQIDGPTKMNNVQAEINSLAKELQSTPKKNALLYFTGHGSPDDERGQFVNNRYDLWGEEELTVRDLSAAIKVIPKSNPLVVVMVECYSGGFANLLFENGNPQGDLIDRPICGFFASVPSRMSAGCTPTTNEADYHDFTGYFFAALTGTTRLGKPLTGADYDHDGKVGMYEAYAYTLINDESIDTPTCTSDAFLRRFVKTADEDIFRIRYESVKLWASPAQKAALEGLSAKLELSTDDRLSKAFSEFRQTNMASEETHDVLLIRFVRLAKSVVLSHQVEALPDQSTKRRFADLVKAEAANPFHN
jgi:hypothetical protein